MTLDSIIERLEKAESGDRELDIAIAKMFPRPAWATDGSWFEKDDFIQYPAYTSSVDEAIELAEKALPGWRYAIERRVGGTWLAWVSEEDEDPSIPTIGQHGAIALCLAILKAKQMGVGE